MLIKLGFSLFNRRGPTIRTFQHIRAYLSENYKCAKSWENRLEPEYMQKVNLDTLYLDIEQSFNQYGKPSVIDVDIFVNKLTDNVNSDEVSDLLHKLRLTEETSNALPSTGHAVVRAFLEHNYIEDLLHILDDRLNYGVFLDHYNASYIMDELIKRKDFCSAARIATFMMLQEDFDNEITLSLSAYACWSYLVDPKPFYPVEEKKEEQGKGKKSKNEEIKIRVKYLRNEYFDDHFDLRDNFLLVGKTLSMIGSHIQKPANIGQNLQLLGEILYQKYDKALTLLPQFKSNLYKDIVATALKRLEQIADAELTESGQQLKTQLQNLSSNSSLNAANFTEDVDKLIKAAIAKCETDQISKQESLYKSWIELREVKLQEELVRLERARRLQDVEKMMENMKAEEQKLWFFENEDKIDLQIDSKKVFYPKRWFGKKKKPRVVDEGYVPPEV